MHKLTVTQLGPHCFRIAVEGILIGEATDQLHQTCLDLLRAGDGVEIDLHGVTYADTASVDLLLDCDTEGARLASPSALLSALLIQRGALRVGTDRSSRSKSSPCDRADESLPDEPEQRFTLDQLARDHGRRAFQLARELVRDDDMARRVVREALLATLELIQSNAGRLRFSAVLQALTARLSVGALQTRSDVAGSIERWLPAFDAAGTRLAPRTELDTPSPEFDPHADLLTITRRCIDQLPGLLRNLLLLHDRSGYTPHELAMLFDVEPTAARRMLLAARLALHSLLEAALAPRGGLVAQTQMEPKRISVGGPARFVAERRSASAAIH